jgi:hypothetical protein
MKWSRLIAALLLTLACWSAPLFAERVRLAEGTPVPVRLKAELAAAEASEGSRVDYVVTRPVTVQGVVVIPEGAVAWGAVQSVKSKALRIDVEGVRLPNLTLIKLRSLREKAGRLERDEIKVNLDRSNGGVVPAGSEFTGYVDEDVWVEVPAAASSAAPATTAPAPVTAPTSATTPAPATAATRLGARRERALAPAPASTATSAPTPAAGPTTTRSAPAAPATSAPADVPAATPAHATAASLAPSAASGERITVECFSDPLGADILIDGEFHGSTPSILKLLVGNYQLEYRLAGYASHSEELNLTPGMGLRTIRATLEKK